MTTTPVPAPEQLSFGLLDPGVRTWAPSRSDLPRLDEPEEDEYDRVRRGRTTLDLVLAGVSWWDKKHLDLDALDMGDPDTDILGQLGHLGPFPVPGADLDKWQALEDRGLVCLDGPEAAARLTHAWTTVVTSIRAWHQAGAKGLTGSERLADACWPRSGS